MSRSDNSKLCGGVGDISSDNKTYTSYAQKVEQKHGACDNGSDNSGGDTNTNTDIVAHEKHTLGSNNDSDVDLSGAVNRLHQLRLHLRSNTTTANNNNDEVLFQEPPPKEDCAICMLPMPYSAQIIPKKTYQPCCGKVLCDGCTNAALDKMRKGELKQSCSFCRVPMPLTGKELVKRIKKRMKLKDGEAFYHLGVHYKNGYCGLSKDLNKAIELYKQAVEFGSLEAHIFMANAYENGNGVDQDFEKAIHHFEIASIRGHESARYALGWYEEQKGNMDRAMKHYLIAAKCGYDDGIEVVGRGYKAGLVTKDEYATALRTHQRTLDEMKSEQRSKAENWRCAVSMGFY